MPNRFQPIPGGTDASQQAAIINSNFAQLDNENVSKIFYDVNGLPSIFIGVGQDRTSQIKVAKSGFDVTTADDSDLAFNSAQNVFKVVDEGSFRMTGFATSNTTASYTHNLGFRPLVMAYIEGGINPGTRTPLPTWTSLSRDDVNHVVNFRTWLNAEVSSTTLYVNFYNSSASDVGPFTIKFYLLQETVDD